MTQTKPIGDKNCGMCGQPLATDHSCGGYTSLNRDKPTESWEKELDKLDVADPNSKGCTISLIELLDPTDPTLENFIRTLLEEKDGISNALSREILALRKDLEEAIAEEKQRCLEAVEDYETELWSDHRDEMEREDRGFNDGLDLSITRVTKLKQAISALSGKSKLK